MISTSLAQEIDRLLTASELSRRQIALRVGVGRSTVDAIANRRRGLKGKDQTTHRPLHMPTSLPERCPQCGYRVYLPCLICAARIWQEESRSRKLVFSNGLMEARQRKPGRRGRRR
jgi:hypothetical protein